jgi:hypothetical protein
MDDSWSRRFSFGEGVNSGWSPVGSLDLAWLIPPPSPPSPNAGRQQGRWTTKNGRPPITKQITDSCRLSHFRRIVNAGDGRSVDIHRLSSLALTGQQTNPRLGADAQASPTRTVCGHARGSCCCGYCRRIKASGTRRCRRNAASIMFPASVHYARSNRRIS